MSTLHAFQECQVIVRVLASGLQNKPIIKVNIKSFLSPYPFLDVLRAVATVRKCMLVSGPQENVQGLCVDNSEETEPANKSGLSPSHIKTP